MKQDDTLWLIVFMLTAISISLAFGFTEIFAQFRRLRPRVVYVHQGGRTTDDDGEAA